MDTQAKQIENIRQATLDKNVQELKKLAKEYLVEVAHLEKSTVEQIWNILEKEEGIDFIASTHFSVLDAQEMKDQQEILVKDICDALEAPLRAAARKAEVNQDAFLRALRPFLMQIRHQILYGQEAQKVEEPNIVQQNSLEYKEFKGSVKNENKMEQMVWKSSMENPHLKHIVFRAKEARDGIDANTITQNTGVAPGKIFAEYINVGHSMLDPIQNVLWETVYPNALEQQMKIHDQVYEVPAALYPHVAKTMNSVFTVLRENADNVFWDQYVPNPVDVHVLKHATRVPQIQTHTNIAKESLQQHSNTACKVVSAPEDILQSEESHTNAVFVKAMPHVHDYNKLFERSVDTKQGLHYCEYLPLFTFLRVQEYTDNTKVQSTHEYYEMDEKAEMIREGLKYDIDKVLDTLIAHVMYLQQHFKKIEQLVVQSGGYFMVVNKTTKLQKKNTTDMKILQEPLLYGCTNATPISFPEDFTSYTPSAYLSYLLHDVGNAFTCFHKVASYNMMLTIGKAIFGKEHMTASFITQEIIPYLNNRLHMDLLQTIEEMKIKKIKEMGLENL